MELSAWAERLLLGETLADKLLDPGALTDDAPGPVRPVPAGPGRPDALRLGDERVPFPTALADPAQRGLMLHFFANHELLAIELFALGLLRFPDAPPAFRRGLARTIREEQRHLTRYLDRMDQLGVQPGEAPVNRFFWDCVADVPTPLDLCVRMGLTLEQANLDFCVQYGRALRQVGDEESAQLLDEVLEDEIGHVKQGLYWFRRWKEEDRSDWEAFQARLQLPLSPSRAKGGELHRDLRDRVGFDRDFVDRLAVYGRSKGRRPDVWLWTPDCEAGLADPHHRSSPAVAALTRDLAALPWVLAARDDLVLVDRPPRTEWLAHLAAAGFELPELAVDLGGRPAGAARPWGWCPVAEARLGPKGTRAPAATHFRKDLAAELLRRLSPDHAVLAGTCCSTWNQVRDAADALTAAGYAPAVKPVLSTAGQGILRRVEEAAVQRLLVTQPAVLVVPWLDRVADLSLHLDLDGGRARVRGWTAFQATAGGSWRRTQAGALQHGLDGPLLRFLHGDAWPGGLRSLAADLAALLADALPFDGPIGVDLLVGRHDDRLVLHPLVELNPRYTMGRLALALRPRIAPASSAWLSLVRDPGDAPLEVPARDELGRLAAGRLWLTDPRGAKVAAVLDLAPPSPEPR
ncbi:MAG: DUF455 family protein [Alphaproteobacteria bacterium]|nr:DUF455 family protein [Alphaproteobacteria bacterium]